MQTDFPTVELYFGFAFTFCKVKVYKTQEPFIRKVLEIHDVEFCTPEESGSWQEVDTRLLADLICGALPKMLEQVGLTGKLARQFLEASSVSSISTR